MKCPHCDVQIHRDLQHVPLFEHHQEGLEKVGSESCALDDQSQVVAWEVDYQQCPACHKQIIFLQNGYAQYSALDDVFEGVDEDQPYEEFLVWPRKGTRACPNEVPKELASDFLEAAAVLPLSPQASAALTRRSLQHLLKDFAGAKKKELAAQIEEVIARNLLPSTLADQLHAVRNIGNFAAHPQKSLSTGEIIPVEPHEAEWNLEVLEDLFDHFFVKPARAKARKDELNRKLAAAGKPQLS